MNFFERHEDYLNWTKLHRSAKPGEFMTFATYPQEADSSARPPIKWRVLQNSGSELFMLSEYILDCKRYHGEYTDITWRDCDLRQWLNDEFYHSAFTDAEKEVVKTTHNTDNGECSPDTDDKVFLLRVRKRKSFRIMTKEPLWAGWYSSTVGRCHAAGY